MRILHTSDWHVGKSLRGHSRIDEHRAVLAEVTQVARDEQVDVALVVGDLFESAAPSPDAQAVVWEALLTLRSTGAEVVVVAGNHDNAHSLEALAPLMRAAGITLVGHFKRSDEGGVVEVATGGGERARIALLPFCSQRYVVKAAELMSQDARDNAQTYAARIGALIAHLTADFSGDAVNVVAAHCFVRGALLGGGERDAQTVFDYGVDSTAFPASAHYVALGHLHRAQQLPGPCPIWYSGSPLAVDFGEQEDQKGVLVVDVTATTPARVRVVPLERPRRLRTVTGTFDELAALAASGDTGDAFLRVVVREAARPGLAEEVRELLPLAVDVRVERAPDERAEPTRPSMAGRSPHELFAAYLESRDVDDQRLTALFARLLDEETAGTAS